MDKSDLDGADEPLSRTDREAAAKGVVDPARPLARRTLLAPLIVLSAAVVALGFGVYRHQAAEIRKSEIAELSAVADLKARELAAWLAERESDARLIGRTPQLGHDLASVIASRGEITRNHLVSFLGSLVSVYAYKSAFVLDAKGEFVLGAGDSPEPAGLAVALGRRALDSREVVRSSPYRERAGENASIIIDILVPLFTSVGGPPAGVVVLRIDARKSIFPLLQQWPVPSETAETLLVRRENEEVVFINELRHARGSALSLRFPLSRLSLSAVQAVLNPGKAVEGIDYRGVPVLAVTRAVEGTRWYLVAKKDIAEVNREALSRAAFIFVVVFVVIAGAGGLFTMRWAYQRRAYEQRLDLERLQREALAKHFDYSVKYARDIVLLSDDSLRVMECNDAAIAAYGYSREELIGMPMVDLRAPEARQAFADDLRKGEQTAGVILETVHRRKDGSVFPVEISARTVPVEGRRFYQDIIRDITVRKAAQRKIDRLTQMYSTLSHTNAAIVRARSEQQLFDDICRVAVEHGGFRGAAIRIADGEALRAVAFSENMRVLAQEIDGEIEPTTSFETRTVVEAAYQADQVVIVDDLSSRPPSVRGLQVARDAGIRSVAALPLRKLGKPVGVLTLNSAEPGFFDREMRALLEEMADDISFVLTGLEYEKRRRQTENALAESEERFRGLAEQSIAGIHIIENGRFTYVNPRGAEIYGYAPQELIGQPLDMVIAEEDRRMVAENIRRRLAGEVKSIQYSLTGLRKDGSRITVGVHGTAASLDGRPVIIALAQDISERERAQRQIAAYLQQLEAAMLGTVQAVSTMVELRDPYTSGHERRVGALARAIAEELGLPKSSCEGLEITGTVHDIGKISVPAEILSKPGRLTEAEFELIKTHSRAGYDILKGVSFPWPLAQTILQHHERLDGSGYPGGLKGDEIILDARILAVADIVESMGSHRPYRPMLGIDAALLEIEKLRGLQLDARVVDACLRLFREKAYKLAL